MELASSFISLLGAYLEGNNLREKNKYKDKFLALNKRYIHEISKPDNEVDTNAIDHIVIELRHLSEAAIASAKA
jgi:hypothetical protein